MNQERDQARPGEDPEERAFTGRPDGPPREPDQPPEGNAELKRSPEQPQSDASDGDEPRGDYGNLPGYGG